VKEHRCVNIFHTFSPLHRTILTFFIWSDPLHFRNWSLPELAV
jgi:hypothetical protein